MGASVVAYVPHDYADLHVLGAAQENIRSQRCEVAVHRPHALQKIRIFPGTNSFTGRQSVDCVMYATPQPNLMHVRWVLDMRQWGPLTLIGAATGAWRPVMELRDRPEPASVNGGPFPHSAGTRGAGIPAVGRVPSTSRNFHSCQGQPIGWKFWRPA
jgi:hypothetical protein